MNLLVISTRRAHFIVQFITVPPSKQHQKLLVLFSGSRFYKLAFSVLTDQLVRCGVLSVEDVSLEDLVGYHFPL